MVGVALGVFEEDRTDVVDGNVDCVCDAGDAEDSLRKGVDAKGSGCQLCGSTLYASPLSCRQLTSVLPGSICSPAFSLAPLAS